MPPRIGILPDIHMRTGEREHVTAQLNETVQDLDEQDIDLLIALGDVIEHGESVEEDVENIRHVDDILTDVSAPVRYMAGNHDPMNIEKDRLEDLFGNDLWGSTSLDGETLIFLDTAAPWLSGSRGEVTEEQLTFLDETLDEAATATIFVHHPIHYHDVSQSYWWYDYPERAFCGNKKEINRILDDHDNLRCVVNAHLHHQDLTIYHDVPHVTLNAFSKETREKPITGTYAMMDLGDEVSIDVFNEEGKQIGYTF